MLQCPKCHAEQETGKFCGVCGEPLQPLNNNEHFSSAETGTHTESSANNVPIENHQNTYQETAATTAQPQNQTMETVKTVTTNYGNYFLELLKNPTKAFKLGENDFVNGIITLILYAITFSLSIYFLANSLTKRISNLFGADSDKLPFFELNSRIVLFVIIFTAVSLISMFIMTKIAHNEVSPKLLIAQYGGFAVPFTTLNILAIITGLAASYILTPVLLAISSSLLLSYIPVLFVYEKVNQVNRQGQTLYISIGTLLIIGLINYIIVKIMLNDLFDKLIDTWQEISYFM